MRPTVIEGIVWSVCLSVRSVCLSRLWALQNCWIVPDAIKDVDSGGPKEPCVRWGCTSTQTDEYDWTVHVRWRCSLMSNYFDL